MQRGRDGEEPFAQFAQLVKGAKAEAEADKVEIIDSAAQTDWKAAAWWLERCRHQRYARRLHEADVARVTETLSEQLAREDEERRARGA